MGYRILLAGVLAVAMLPFFGGMASGQIPGMSEVSGRYVNEEFGVEIVFPDGWEGFELVSGDVLSVMTSEDDVFGGEVIKFISFGVVAKSQVQDPTDPIEQTQDQQDQQVECETPVIESIQVSGKRGYQTSVECEQVDGQTYKYKAVSVETETHWATVVYAAPGPEFDEDESNFDSTVDSLRVDGAIDVQGDLADAEVDLDLEFDTVPQSVVVAGETIDLELRTSSTIDSFQLDEENRRISFMVDGPDGTPGTTEISIGRILEGPYMVTIDGETTTNYDVTNEGSTDAVMTISYSHSVHEIEVAGTNVIPEFPAAILIVATVIGSLAVVGRTRLFRMF